MIGTHDGASIEILEEVGEEKMFIFGLKAAEVMPPARKNPIGSRIMTFATPERGMSRIVSLPNGPAKTLLAISSRSSPASRNTAAKSGIYHGIRKPERVHVSYECKR